MFTYSGDAAYVYLTPDISPGAAVSCETCDFEGLEVLVDYSAERKILGLEFPYTAGEVFPAAALAKTADEEAIERARIPSFSIDRRSDVLTIAFEEFHQRSQESLVRRRCGVADCSTPLTLVFRGGRLSFIQLSRAAELAPAWALRNAVPDLSRTRRSPRTRRITRL